MADSSPVVFRNAQVKNARCKMRDSEYARYKMKNYGDARCQVNILMSDFGFLILHLVNMSHVYFLS